MSNVCVFGASGKTGGLLVEEATGRGYKVTAFLRTVPSASVFPSGTNILVGDLTDQKSVLDALENMDAVVCTFGPRPPHTEIFCASATGVILESMKTRGVPRLICITGAMIGNYSHNRSTLFNAMAKTFARQRPNVAQDRIQQEQLITKSELTWTIVKPPRLTDKSERGSFKAGPDLKMGLLSGISRFDLARFIVNELEVCNFLQQCVFIKN